MYTSFECHCQVMKTCLSHLSECFSVGFWNEVWLGVKYLICPSGVKYCAELDLSLMLEPEIPGSMNRILSSQVHNGIPITKNALKMPSH